MKSKILVVAATLLLAATSFAADISGKWTAEVPGRGGQTRTTTFVFAVDGEKLTGTVSGMGGENAISDGTVKGDDIAFNVAVSFNGNDLKLIYTGKVAGDEIKMSRTREGAEAPAQEFTAKRAQ